MNARAQIEVHRLPGYTPYARAWALQQQVHAEVRAGARTSTLLLLEHPRTLTMGRRGGWAHLRTAATKLDAMGFERWQIDRGGDITYHGPGQLVGYPIFALAELGLELSSFLRGIEAAHIELYGEHGISAKREDGFTGVWTGLNKLTAIGVRLTGGVTMHGFASNITTNLDDFSHILACGLEGRGVTSMQNEGVALAMDLIEGQLVERLCEHWQVQVRERSQLLKWPAKEAVEALVEAHCASGA